MNCEIIERKIILLAMLNKNTEALEIESFQPYVLKEKKLITEGEYMQCKIASSPSDSLRFKSNGDFEFFYDTNRIIITAFKESTMGRCVSLLNSILTNYGIDCKFLGCNHHHIISFASEGDIVHFCNHYVPNANWTNVLGDEAEVVNFQMAKHGKPEELIPERIVSVQSIEINSDKSNPVSGIQVRDIYNYEICNQYTFADYFQDIESTVSNTKSTIQFLLEI